MSLKAPALLRPDNFTPPSRTPWGGTRLARDYKRAFVGGDAHRVIGESWEVSVEPDFPVRLDNDELLSAYIATDPRAIVGAEAERSHGSTALLVKLLDAAEPLSVQIHPSDDYPGLEAGESGKPESWYVVERDEGAGFYLGFQPGTEPARVRAALERGETLEPLLRFVPVDPGDFFLIDAGTPHAIGGGVTLVEPQHVRPGQRGVTYRYWDWNRRYDTAGKPNPSGSPRALHVAHALAVTEWERVQRPDFVDRIRVRGGAVALTMPPTWLWLAGETGLPSPFLRVSRVAGSGRTTLPTIDRMHAITVLAGQVNVGAITITRGRSAVVPACLAGAELVLQAAHALVCAIA